MKKYLFILGIVGTALFTACSTADDLVSEKPNETPPVEEPKETAIIVEASQDSEEPITLGIGQSRGYTRTPLNSTEVDVEGYGNFTTEDGRYIGVFCLATGTQTGVSNIPTAVASNHWSADDNGQLGGLLVKLKDVPAKVTNSGSTYSFKFWRITGDKEEHYYYPMGNLMKYNFYAYYPQTNSSSINIEEIGEAENQKSKVEVTGYEIDGSQDLIWGMSDQEHATPVAASGADPYCAKYFRLAREAAGGGDISAYYPEFKFNHQLVQFNFFVKAATDDAFTALTATKAKITDMYIDNAIYKLKFCVASQADGFNDCQLTKDGDLAAVTTQLGIKKRLTNDNVFSGSYNQWVKEANDVVSPQTVSNGYVGYIMLPSPNVNVTGDPSFKYRLVMKMIYDGSPGSDEVSIELTPPLVPGTGTDPVTNPERYEFLANHSYNIIVRVVSPEEIFATAVLQEWETYVDGSSNPFINYEVE